MKKYLKVLSLVFAVIAAFAMLSFSASALDESVEESNYDDGCFVVTWVAGDRTVKENWPVGSVPTPPISLTVPESTDVYTYAFQPTEAVTGDVTYTAVPKANFNIYANISLNSKFVYNMYVPVDIWTSVNSVKIDEEILTPSATEIVAINSRDYYVFKYDIEAAVAADSFNFVINLDGYKGDTFDQVFELSIPSYADKVLNAGYSTETKEFIEDILVYIKSAYIFVGNSVPDSIENLLPSNYEVQNYDGVQVDKPAPAAVKELISGISLALTEGIEFRFIAKEGADLSKSITFKYFKNGKSVEEEISGVDQWSYDAVRGYYYYPASMRAKDFGNKNVTVALDGCEWQYNLSNYIYDIKNTPVNERPENYEALCNLADSVWAYSGSASTYQVESPEVDITIANNSVDQYEIILTDTNNAEINQKIREAAEALVAAVKYHTGYEIPIADSNTSQFKDINISVVTGSAARDYTADFKVTVDANGNLNIVCQYASFVVGGMQEFVNTEIYSLSSSKNFDSNYQSIHNSDRIYYSDFGAVGDGVLTEILKPDGTYDRDLSGASGTNDFEAIRKTHIAANTTKRHTVYADPGKTYLISESTYYTYKDDKGTHPSYREIVIQTNTVWTGANFLIDDRVFTSVGHAEGRMSYHNIFEISSDESTITITDDDANSFAGIGSGTTSIDLTSLGVNYPAYVKIINANHQNYIRYGYSNSSQDQQDCILVDANGNIDPATPIIFNYSQITRIDIKRADVEPITIVGGEFCTVASGRNNLTVTAPDGTKYTGQEVVTHLQNNGLVIYDKTVYYAGVNGAKPTTKATGYDVSTGGSYIYRGIGVNRPNVTLIGVEHRNALEFTLKEQISGLFGTPYRGFFAIQDASNVTLDSCVLSSRRYYSTGTYGFSANASINVTLKNCTQNNYYVKYDADMDGIEDETEEQETCYYKHDIVGEYIYWGIGGTSHCKNLVYDGCTLSRYDAHAGVFGGKILNSTVAILNLIGGGDFLIENSTVENSSRFINLRGDYGSTWDGTITIKNSTLLTDTTRTPAIFNYTWSNHNFGYTCVFPNVVLEKIQVEGWKTERANNNISLLYKWTSGGTLVNDDRFSTNSDEGDQYHLSISADVQNATMFNGKTNINPITPPEFIRVINCDDVTLELMSNYAFFSDTDFVEENFDEYTVSFDVAGGAPTIEAQTVIAGGKAIAPVEIEKEGYTFLGWYNGDVAWNFDTVITSDITLTAHWTINSYTVAFDSDGGSAVYATEVNYGGKITEPVAPIKAGFVFAGWLNGETLWDFDNDVVTDDITLKAKWVIDVYTVTFDSNGGSEVANAEVYHGDKIIEPTAPTKEGYSFAGWYNGDVAWNFDTAVTSDVTLEAAWVLNTYTVRFYSVGGSEVPNATVSHGEKVDEPVPPTKEGYIFAGWYNGDVAWNFDTAVTSDIALTAHWTVFTYVETDFDSPLVDFIKVVETTSTLTP